MKSILCIESESESESVISVKKRVIMKELVKGHEAASQLKVLLENPFESQASLSSQKLMASVLRSFTQSLSIVTSSSAHANQSGKKSKKGGRGPYNKRWGQIPELLLRRRSASAWTKLSSTTDDDNHAWKKNGKKEILNSKFPRSYFRCSHKYDQGCRATKQVQLDQENPDMYRITYIGIHTCNATSKDTYSATDSTSWESYLVNSDRDSQIPNVQDHHHISIPNLAIKQKENASSDDVTDHKLDPSLWSDLKDLEPYIQSLPLCP